MSESNYRPIGINYSNGKPTGFVELKDLVISSISSFAPGSGVVIEGKLIVNGDVSADNLAGIALPDFLSDLNQLVVDGYATGDQYLYFSAASAVALGTITNFGRQLASSTGTSQASSVLGLADFAFKSSLDFEELGNFSGPAPTGNQTLIYNDSAGRWVASTPPSVAAQYFSSLLDVSFTSPESSSVIYYDTGEKKWKNSQVRLYQLQTSDAADAKYLTQDNAAATYLSQSTAATTYLTQSSASTRYLSASDASNVYLTQSSAATRYLAASDATGTYLTQANAATTYLTQTNATNTYLSKSDAVTHYINASGDSANASFYFQNLSGTTFSATTLDLDNPLSINNGGTNTTATPNSSGIIYFDGTSYNSTDNIKFVSGNTLSATNLKLTNALPITQGGTAATATEDARSNLGLAIGTNVQGYSGRFDELRDLANGIGTLSKWGTIPYVKVSPGVLSGWYGLSAGPTEYGYILRILDPYATNPVLSGIVGEPTWGFLALNELTNVSLTATPQNNATLFYNSSLGAWTTTYQTGGFGGVGGDSPGLEGLRNVNASSVLPSVNVSILDGDPFVWDSAASAWGHRNITNFAGNIAPELNPYFVSAGGGTYASSNYRVSSLSANNIFASASVPANVPLQVRFAPSSTTSHVLFASADGTEIARINLRGNNNLFFGFRGGMNMTSTTRSTGVGHYSLEYLTTGNDNTAFGYLANYTVNTGARNTAVGSESSRNLTTASDNTSIGHQANHTLVNGAFNTAVGAGASRDASSGQGNVSVGYRALYNNQVGTGNIGIGYRAGQSFSGTIAGSNNIAIGYDSNQSGSNSYSNTITIGSGIASTASNQTIIGHPSTSSTLIRGAVSATSYVNAPTTSGTFTVGDMLYYNGSVWVALTKPANPAVLLIDDLNGTGLPYWEEAPNTAPNTTYTLQVTTDGSNNPGAIFWG